MISSARNSGVCIVPISPVRSLAADTSEMVTQLLFGEVVECLAHENQWIKIRVFADNYEGWIDEKQIVILRDKEIKRWMNGLTVEHSLIRTIESPLGLMNITRGAVIPSDSAQEFKIGTGTYKWVDSGENRPQSTIDFAMSYLNTPYLWGGKSAFGIDCSGFVQQVHRFFDINLPRDASQQVEIGADIEFGEHQAGDVAFFKNEAGKVHHVGILINEAEIIHASGFVRIDDFSSTGIIRRSDESISHRFHSIRRF